MKKFILAAAAAAALGAGGAASAQNIGDVLANVLGYGNPVYSNAPNATIHTDRYGRQYYYDGYGRQVFLQSNPIVGYDRWGRALYGQRSLIIPGGRRDNSTPEDIDGDGVANIHDRNPGDSRSW